MFVAAGLLMATGCASMFTGQSSTIRLKVVDARTGQPLSGASVVWREDLDDLLAGHLQNGPTNLPPSDESGIIVIGGVRNKMVGRFILSEPGYSTMYGVYSDGELNVSDDIQPPPIDQGVFTLDDAQTAGLADGNFVVRMHR